MSPQFNDYTVISFIDFDSLLEQEKLLGLTEPGLFGIHCFTTNKTLLMYSYYLLACLVSSYDELEGDLFQLSKELLEDYQRLRPKNFAFIIIAFGPQFDNLKLLDESFLALKQSWPFELYESKYF